MSMNYFREAHVSVLIFVSSIDKNLTVLKIPILMKSNGHTSIMNAVQSSHDIGPRIIVGIVVSTKAFWDVYYRSEILLLVPSYCSNLIIIERKDISFETEKIFLVN